MTPHQHRIAGCGKSDFARSFRSQSVENTRIPVMRKDIDKYCRVSCHIKDLLSLPRRTQKALSLREILRRPPFGPETKHGGFSVREMQTRHTQMAVRHRLNNVEQQALSTWEDIIEEIVGNLPARVRRGRGRNRTRDETHLLIDDRPPSDDCGPKAFGGVSG